MNQFQYSFLLIMTLITIILNLSNTNIYSFREHVIRKKNLLYKEISSKGYENSQSKSDHKNFLDFFAAFSMSPTFPQKYSEQNQNIVYGHFAGFVYKLTIFGLNLYVIANTLFWNLTDFEIPLVVFFIILIKGFYVFIFEPISEYLVERYQIENGNIYLPSPQLIKKFVLALPDLYMFYVLYNLIWVAVHKAVG